MLRSNYVSAKSELTELETALRIATTENVVLSEKSPATNKTIAETDLRNKTGVTIIVVMRNDEAIVNPPADFTLKQNDSLVLLAESEKIKNAVQLLQIERGKEDQEIFRSIRLTEDKET